ncbi:MAG: ethanolamine utilization protein EutN [bacterium]|nr:ethanolamine utilization protein EutN [bacterium]
MILAKVVGTVVSTQKDPKLAGLKLMLLQTLDMNMKLTGNYVVAADSVGAGHDEVVCAAAGSSARLTDNTDGLPVDLAIIAIVDSLEVDGKYIYQKSEEPAAAGV